MVASVGSAVVTCIIIHRDDVQDRFSDVVGGGTLGHVYAHLLGVGDSPSLPIMRFLLIRLPSASARSDTVAILRLEVYSI